MEFLLWQAIREAGHCGLSPADIEEVDRLDAGEVVPAEFAQPIKYEMSDNFPDDIELSDNYETGGQIVISSRLKTFLQKILPQARTQYLPAKVINHKGRVAAADYSILHLHDVCDCIDIEASQIEWNPLNKSRIMGCESLILKPDAVSESIQAFRLKFWGSNIVVRRSLANALEDQGFIGLAFVEPTEYTGVG
jgi:hypothetical protein